MKKKGDFGTTASRENRAKKCEEWSKHTKTMSRVVQPAFVLPQSLTTNPSLDPSPPPPCI